jgi:tetratricopeptide (TPR) repeat protein
VLKIHLSSLTTNKWLVLCTLLVTLTFYPLINKIINNLNYTNLLSSQILSRGLDVTKINATSPSSIYSAHLYYFSEVQQARPDVFSTSDALVLYFTALGDKNYRNFDLALLALEQLHISYPSSVIIREQLIDTLVFAATEVIYEQNLERSLDYLAQAENLGADDEIAFYSVALALQKAGALEIANKYFEKASYYKLSPRFINFFYNHLPTLINNQIVSEEYIHNLQSFLIWRNMAAEAEWLEALTGANRQSQEHLDPIQPVILPDKGLAEFIGIEVGEVSLGPNIINNGGFEKARKDSLPEFWSWAAGIGNPFRSALFVGGPDTLSPFSGETSLRISGLWSEKEPEKLPARAGFESYPLTIKPNSKYLLSLYYKTENLSEGNPAILLDIFQGRRLGDYFMLPSTDGEWKLFLIIGRTSDNCCSSREIFLSSFATGTVWFDDVSLRELILPEEPGKPIELPYTVVH